MIWLLEFQGKLYHHTICPSARQAAGSHYDLHNMYGITETMVTNAALRSVRPKLRPFIISRSTFPGQGRYGGHWTGDIYSDWDAMKYSISGSCLWLPLIFVSPLTSHSCPSSHDDLNIGRQYNFQGIDCGSLSAFQACSTSTCSAFPWWVPISAASTATRRRPSASAGWP